MNVLICINIYNFNTSLIIKNTLKYWRAIICVTENCYQVLQPLLYSSVLNYILASSKTNKQTKSNSFMELQLYNRNNQSLTKPHETV